MEINLPMLAQQPFLAGMAERHLKVLLQHSMPATFKMDEFIFYEERSCEPFLSRP